MSGGTRSNESMTALVACIATVIAAFASCEATKVSREALKVSKESLKLSQDAQVAAISGAKEAGQQVERIATQAITTLQDHAATAKTDATNRVKPIVVVPPGEYIVAFRNAWPANFLSAETREKNRRNGISEIHVNALPVENYGGGPATGVEYRWASDLSCSVPEGLTPGTLSPGDASIIDIAGCIPDNPDLIAGRAITGTLEIICKDINRKGVQTTAKFTISKYGTKPIPHAHIEIEDYELYQDCPICGTFEEAGEAPAPEAAPPLPAPMSDEPTPPTSASPGF